MRGQNGSSIRRARRSPVVGLLIVWARGDATIIMATTWARSGSAFAVSQASAARVR